MEDISGKPGKPIPPQARPKSGSTSEAAEALSAAMAELWNADPSPGEEWRQVSAVPQEPIKIGETEFKSLFPGAAIKGEKFASGFPFQGGSPLSGRSDQDLQHRGVHIPSIPKESGARLWIVRRDGSFAYREPIGGALDIRHPHIRPVMSLACAMIAFIPKLAAKARIDDSTSYTLAFEFEGFRGRGLVIPVEHLPLEISVCDDPEKLWSDETLRVELFTTIAEMRQDIVNTSIRFISELTRLLAPSLTRQGLRSLLKKFHEDELRRHDKNREFGVLDGHL